jgi:two-component system sensor kinase FixL
LSPRGPDLLHVSPQARTGGPGSTASIAELELRAVLDAAVDAVIIIDSHGAVETFSKAAEILFGYTAAEVIGRNVSILMPEPFRSQHDGYLHHHIRTGEQRIIGKGREVVAQRRDGTLFPVFLSVGRIARLDPPRFVGLISDISDRKRVVEALRRERDRAQAYLDLAEVMLLALDSNGTISLVNRKGCEILGWPEDELVGRNWFTTCLPPELCPEVQSMFDRFFTGTASPAHYAEHEVVTRSGERKLIAWRNVVLRDERGLISGTLSSGEDVTDQRRAIEALQKSEQLLRDAQSIANLGNYEIHLRDGQASWSTQLHSILGTDPEYGPLALQEFLERCVHPDDRDSLLAAWGRLTSHEEPMDVEYRIRRPDGSIRYVHSIARLTRDTEGNELVVGTLHDITERKHTQEEVRQTQQRLTQFARLSTMGEMAAGLAHEINQPLTAIANYSQALQRLLAAPVAADPADVKLALSQISAQALRAGEVIRRLRSFVKNREARTESIDPGRLIEDLMVFAEPDARVNDIRIRVEHDEGLPQVACDPVQIQQVLLNLIRNAIDATNEAAAANREISLRARKDESGAIEISVEDHGVGISPQVAENLGNPFYTTKSSGTGLGIAISRSILRAHGGRLSHRPTPDGGATVFFTLPAMPGSEK